jgi:hypothetical protein
MGRRAGRSGHNRAPETEDGMTPLLTRVTVDEADALPLPPHRFVDHSPDTSVWVVFGGKS